MKAKIWTIVTLCAFVLCFAGLASFGEKARYTNRLVDEPTLSLMHKDSSGSKVMESAVPDQGAGGSSASAGGGSGRPSWSRDVRHDVSLPLSWMPVDHTGPGKIALEIVNRPVPKKGGRSTQDSSVQSSPFSTDISVTPNIPSTGQDFPGISFTGWYPPDTNGDVGPNHYIQTVNVKYSIYSKTGTLLRGPDSINTLWSGFGGPCQTTNNGDPTVLHDQLADRWLVTQLSFPNGSTTGPYYQCIAVSQTADPLGSWNRYEFTWSSNLLNDYPHPGVWPDGYYMSCNEFLNGASFAGAGAAAFERAKMLNGQSAQMVVFHQVNDGGQLPSDLTGPNAPPNGTPNFFADWETSAVHLWKFHVDWTTPGNSTFTSQLYLTVNSFSQASSVPQPGTTTKLAALSDRLMYRLSYRNFPGDHDALVLNHSVSVGGIAGVRWYEVRNPNSSPSVFQQGTYAPSDGVHRWMGSVAMDASGDIAAGYSVSDPTSVYPGIRYTGRVPSDPLGTLPQGEGTIISGGGSQTGASRWGDYSSMSIDPSDDCTFWYTDEYYQSTASVDWRTRIASFKFPSCGGGGGCSSPSGLSNNTAADVSACADTGVLVTWSQDAGSWGDGGSGTRTYDVLRDGVAVASGLPYLTTSYNDNGGNNGQSYNYSVRYNNGCGSNATTTGASAADNISAPAVTETANQLTSPITAQNTTVTSALSPAFTITGLQANSATVTWALSGNTNLTSCVAIRLRAPNPAAETTLKAIGAVNTGSANVLSFYQTNGPGSYTIVLQELAGCGGKGNRKAQLSATTMTVQKPGTCP